MGPDYRTVSRTGADVAGIDAGLREYMLRVYNYMIGGLVLSGTIAYLAVSVQSVAEVVFPLRLPALFACLGIAFFMGFRIQKMQATTAQLLFWVFAGLMGVAISPIVAMYTGASVAKTFFICAGTFAAMSLYGYTTKADLSRFGSFLMMGLIGLILAIVVNIFLASPALDFAISVIGVLIFTGLTAWDTQQIKEWYAENDGHDVALKKAVFGALNLYMDFINLFLFLLRFLGVARSD